MVLVGLGVCAGEAGEAAGVEAPDASGFGDIVGLALSVALSVGLAPGAGVSLEGVSPDAGIVGTVIGCSVGTGVRCGSGVGTAGGAAWPPINPGP